MDEQNFDWKTVRVKLEPEHILNENDKTDDDPIDSFEEAAYQVSSSTFQEQTQNVSKSTLNFMSGLPATTSPMPSTSHVALEGTLKIKEEMIEDENSVAEPFLHVGQPDPSEIVTSVYLTDGSALSEERIDIKTEDDFVGRNVPQEEHQEIEFIDAEKVIKMEDVSEEGSGFTKNSHQQDFVNVQNKEATEVSNKTVDFSAGSQSEESQYFGVPIVVGTNIVYYLVNKIENYAVNGSQSLETPTTSTITPPLVDNSTTDDVKPNELISSPSSNLYPPVSRPFDEGTFTCERCFARFQTESELKAHLPWTRCNKRLFFCSQCSAQFKTKKSLSFHLRTHTDAQAFFCHQCSAQFSEKKQLRSHLRIHSTERTFSCDQCSAQFKKKENLKKHMITHSNEKPFSCDLCPARFKRKSNLNDHLLQIHSNERAFSCDRCSARFKTKAYLKFHLQTHSNEKPFHCDQCSARFTTKAYLKAHSQIHSDEKAFSCNQCSKRYNTKTNLKVHLRIHSDSNVP